MEIIIDSREKDTAIRDYFDRNLVDYKIKKMSFGDFSFTYKNKSFEKIVVIERKKNFAEIMTNLCKKRSRFYREFHKARLHKAKMVIMIEQTELDLWKHNYYSKVSPIDCKKMIDTFCDKYLIDYYMIRKEESPEFILSYFQRYMEVIK